MSDGLTFEQFCTLDCSRNMVVTAGPGAGKTRVLSERLCHLILTNSDVGIGDIVALTFTEKAAEEMKTRVYMELSRLFNRMKAEHGGAGLLKRRLKECLDTFSKNNIGTIHSFCAYLLRQYPVESGIDSGFVIVQGLIQREMILDSIQRALSSLAREKPDDLADLMRIFGSRRYLLEAVKQAMEHPVTFERALKTWDHLFKKKDWKEQVFSEYCRFIKEDVVTPYYKGLSAMKNDDRRSGEIVSILHDWRKVAGSRSDDFGIPALFARLRDYSSKRQPRSSRLAVAMGNREISYLDIVDTYFPDLFAIFNPDRIFEASMHIFFRLVSASLDGYRARKSRVNALDFSDLEERTLVFLRALSLSKNRLAMKRIRERFKYFMIDEFQDTSQTQWEIIKLLVSDGTTKGDSATQRGKLFVVGDKRQAIYRFRGADVTIFDAVTEEIIKSQGSHRRLFFCHDDGIAKRMYAGSRDMEERLEQHSAMFNNLSPEEQARIESGDIHLSFNFRSDSELIRFFNRTFAPLFDNKDHTDIKNYESKYISMRGAQSSGCGVERGSAAFYVMPLKKGKHYPISPYGKEEMEAALVADIIERIIGKAGTKGPEYQRYRSIREKIEAGETAIGILFFSYTHIKTFETVLREAGLPFIVNKGRGFYRCDEVMDMVQLLAYLVDARRKISLLTALRGSIFALTDQEICDLFNNDCPIAEAFHTSSSEYVRNIGDQLSAWQVMADHLSIPQMIRIIMQGRGLAAALSVHPNRTQRLANMEKLIETARRFESEGNGSLADFVTYCLRMADEEEDEGEAVTDHGKGASIRLMTIHAAKGLEFPMVIIPELHRSVPRGLKPGKPVRLYRGPHAGSDAWNDREGILPLFSIEYPLADYAKILSPLSFLLNRRDMLENVAENRRVFYVGCTRAMRHLVLTGYLSMEKSNDDGNTLTPGDYREGLPIIELLDDIWKIRNHYKDETVGSYPHGGESPFIHWVQPEPRKFTGTCPAEKILFLNNVSRSTDKEVAKIDFTNSLEIPSFYQFSPTGLALFKKCPLRFYYKHILNIQEHVSLLSSDSFCNALYDDKTEGEALEQRTLGTLVHAYLQRHVFGYKLDRNLLETIFSSVLDRGYEAMILHGKVLEGIRARTEELILRVIADRHLVKLLRGTQQYSELPFVFNGNGYTMRGRIDKVFREKKSNDWALMDWKTEGLQGEDPIVFSRARYYDLQLACYRFVVEALMGVRVSTMYLFFIAAGGLVKLDYTGDLIEEIDNLIGFIRSYTQDAEKDRKAIKEAMVKEGTCLTCNYNKTGICKESTVVARDVRSGKGRLERLISS